MYEEYWKQNTYEIADRVSNIKNLLKTSTPLNTKFIRKGSAGDGGYVIADDIKSNDYLVSFGIDNNVDFEKSISEYGCKSDLYDNSIEELPSYVKNSTFFKKTIGIHENEISLGKSLKNITEDIILKVDIEGSEWDIFSQVSLEDLSKCRQILIEVHWMQNLNDEYFYSKALTAFTKLRSTHTPVLVHANNNVPLMIMGNSPVPMVFEILYLRTVDYTFAKSEDPFDGLVVKNDVNFPEIGLSFP
jgi:hypothetical protein